MPNIFTAIWAKAFYETGNYRQAQPLYVQAFSFDNSDAEALKGVIFSSWKLRRLPHRF